MILKKLVVLLFLASYSKFALSSDFNIGNWRLGMSRSDVTSAYSASPFIPVSVTGGFEISYPMLGEPSTVSFVFNQDKLSYVQVFAYEGKDFKDAKEAAMRILKLFNSEFGGASIHGVKINDDQWLNEEIGSVVLDRILGTAPEISTKLKNEKEAVALFTLDAQPRQQPENCRIHAQFIYSARYETFYVFLFQDLVDSQDRTSKAMVNLEKL